MVRTTAVKLNRLSLQPIYQPSIRTLPRITHNYTTPSVSLYPSASRHRSATVNSFNCTPLKYTRRFQHKMAKPKVLLLGDINHAKEAFKDLQNIAEVVEPKSDNRKDFIEECKSGGLDGVVAAYRTFASVSTTGFWDEELVSALPKSLKFVSHNGAGYDQIRPAALSNRDPPIIATHVPTAVDDATADTALFLLLGALRNFNASMFTLRKGEWAGNPYPPLGHDPQGMTLGVLGMGGIGRNFAVKCRALGMSVQYHNRRRLASADLEGGAKYVSFEELLRTSDVLSVHVPLNEHTRHLLGEKELGMCKDGVVIINTARGAVIDEAALVKKLEEGKVFAVGLDVFEEEPKVHEGLIKHDRAFLLPHMGTWTHETSKKMEEWNLGNVKAAVQWSINGKEDEARKMSVVSEQHELWEKMLQGGGGK